MTVIYQDNFDSYTAGSQLNGLRHWTAPTTMLIANDTSSGGTNSVRSTTTGAWQEAYISDSDGNGGDAIVSADVEFTIGGASVYLALREVGPMLSNQGYYALFNSSNGNLSINRWQSSSATAMATVSAFGITSGFYNFRWQASGSNFSLQVQRLSDGKYLDHNGTSWNTTQGNVLTGTDSTFTGSAKAGFGFFQGSANDVRLDNFIFQTPTGFSNVVQSKLVGFPAITEGETGSITGATNATPIVITSTAHGLGTGTLVAITGVGGNTNANATWAIIVLNANSFLLNGSSGNAAYTSGGTWTVKGVAVTMDQSVAANNMLLAVIGTYAYPLFFNITGATNATPIEITTGSAHGLSTGAFVQVAGVSGNTAANGDWIITVTSTTTFTLKTVGGVNSVGNGSYIPATGYWTPNPITDNIGNGNWEVLGGPSVNGQNILSAHFIYSSLAGQPTITIKPFPGTSGFPTVFLAELSGINVSTADSFVKGNGVTQSTNSPGTTTVSTTRDLVIAAFCQGNDNIDNATVDSGFTMLGFQPGGIPVECLAVAAKISGSNQTPTFSTFEGGSAQTITWSGLGVSLKAVVSSGSVLVFEDDMSKYIGDVTAGSVVKLKFFTFGADGTPTTLTGSPTVAVYKDSTTESTAGVSSISVDYDSRTGLNRVQVDTSADGTFYAAGNDYDVVLTAGTVGSVSWVGKVVATFSIENRTARLRGIAHTDFPAETNSGGMEAAFKNMFDVASPRATADANATTGIVALGDLATDYMRRQKAADFVFNDSLPAGPWGSDNKALISTATQDLSGSLSVNAKNIAGVTQTGFDIGLLSSKLNTLVELDPNAGSSPPTTLYRFTQMGLARDLKALQNNMNAADLIGQLTYTADSGTIDGKTTGQINGVAYGNVLGVNYLFVSDTNHNRILVFDATPGLLINNKTAKFVLGQADFVTGTANTPGFGTTTTGSKCLSGPQGMAFDTTGYLWVADTGNHRVLRYNFTSAIATNQGADVVLGQTDMTGHSANKGGAAGSQTLSSPIAVAWAPSLTEIFVADQGNHRVVGYTSLTTNAAGVAFVGQTSSATTLTGLAANRFNGVSGLGWDDANLILYVGDGGNNRILAFAGGTTNGNASFVLGQINFTTNGSANGISQTNVVGTGPQFAIHTERSWLLVPDDNNERLMIWDLSEGLKANFVPATYILGQSEFNQSIFMTTRNRAVNWLSVAVDPDTDRIFVGQSTGSNGRVAVYQVNSYLRRNLKSDFPTMNEPAVSYFSSNPNHVNANIVDGLSVIYVMCTNERFETATQKTLFNQAGSTIGTATITAVPNTSVDHGKFS